MEQKYIILAIIAFVIVGGSMLSITNLDLDIKSTGTGTLTCYMRQYNNGNTFTISQGSTKSIPTGGQMMDGRCYCAKTYQTDYVDIQVGSCSDPGSHKICGTYSPKINLQCSSSGGGTGSTYCEQQGYSDSRISGQTCTQILQGGTGGVCYDCHATTASETCESKGYYTSKPAGKDCVSVYTNALGKYCYQCPSEMVVKIVEYGSPKVKAGTNSITGTVYFENDGKSMSDYYIVEMQVRPKGLLPLSIGSQEECDPSTPENVHKAFKLSAGQQASITLTSSVDPGTYDVYFLTRDKCYNADPIGNNPVGPYPTSKEIGGIKVGGTATTQETTTTQDNGGNGNGGDQGILSDPVIIFLGGVAVILVIAVIVRSKK